MKLVLFISNKEINSSNKQVEIMHGKLEDIDNFTTLFADEKHLLNSIIKSSSNNIDTSKIKYRFSIVTKDNIYPVLYSNYRFFTNREFRRRTLVKLGCMDPSRIYEYIEHKYYYLLYNELEDDAFKSNLFYRLAILIEKNNYESNELYRSEFIKELKNKYNLIRNMAINILSQEEINEITGNNRFNNNPINNEPSVNIDITDEIISICKCIDNEKKRII
ncbi:MAG: hypothetical protein J6J17_00710 [Bacilli bacterium]|nr:hypothetical protein [Bacilli bacterium]